MITERDIFKTFKELPISTVRKLFRERTWSRDILLESVFHNTVDVKNRNPCITVGGLKTGAPCDFPFIYPDCTESFKPVNKNRLYVTEADH